MTDRPWPQRPTTDPETRVVWGPGFEAHVETEPGKLEKMMKLQYELQRDVMGVDYANLTDEQRIHHFKEMLHAFNDEMHEALGEMGWKPWATSRHFNTSAVQGELIDAWHFFMNLMMIAGLTPETLTERYLAKREKNIKRQAEGYDGIAGKCPKCKRALDDEDVTCHTIDRREVVFCCHYNPELGTS